MNFRNCLGKEECKLEYYLPRNTNNLLRCQDVLIMVIKIYSNLFICSEKFTFGKDVKLKNVLTCLVSFVQCEISFVF